MSPRVLNLPDLGEGLTEAHLVRWLVAVGDEVTVDVPIAEVETAKATVEVPTPFAGVIVGLHGEEGVALAVGEPLITVDDPSGEEGGGEPVAHAPDGQAGSGNVLIGYGTVGDGPGRRRRRKPASDGTGGGARNQSVDTVVPDGPPDRPAVRSPLVRKLAKSRGIDLAALVGTGPDGMITRRDVEAATAETPAPADERVETTTGPPVPPSEGVAGTDPRTGLALRARLPLDPLRRAVVRTVARSRHDIPDATTWVDVDATALVDLRASLAGPDGSRPGLLAIIARFVVAGLHRFPELNACFDSQAEEIRHFDGVNLGIATQTARGLVVPAVRNAHRHGMRDLDAEIRRTVTAARDGSLPASELGCGSFTLNNYGVFGVDGSAAIINHPEVAILGLGRVVARPWVVGGAVVARQVTQLSLVFDHRVCDGGTAGGFLRFIADAVESPLSAMAEL